MPHRYHAIPKIDLHRHLEGALRPETLWDFHQREKQSVYTDFAALKAAVTVPLGERPGFPGFLSRFNGLYFRYGGLKALERLAAEAVADAAEDGVIYLELRFSPAFAARRLKENPPGGWLNAPPEPREAAEAAAEAIIGAARAEAARRKIHVGFILSLGRHFRLAGNLPQAELLSRPVGKQFCGIDLAGFEAILAAEFREVIAQWRASGKGVTIHAGEDPQGPGAKNVREAIDELHADRIGHGVRAGEDALLVKRLAEQKTALELCPTSNLQTQACPSWELYPLKRYLEAGVRVTVNTDDPAISQITLSDEYAHATEECGLTHAELKQCTLNAAEAAFATPDQKKSLINQIQETWA
jgi:adenosine deaminase